MELTVEKQAIRSKEEIKTESQEHALDSELILPDFYPDIARILKCKGEPVVLSKQVGGGTVTLEGAVTVGLLYVDEEGDLRYYTQNLPFYHEFSVPEEDVLVTAQAKMDYLNCRAVNTRKVELHGAVSLRVHLYRLRDTSVVTAAAGAGVEMLTTQGEVTTLQSAVEKAVTITDEIQIDAGSIRSVLRSGAVVQNGEYKVVTGKTVVKGELAVTALYQNTDGGYDHLRAALPFTQILDTENTDEKTACFLRFTVTSLELRPRTGLDGECRNVMVTAGVTVAVETTKTLSLTMAEDAYSTRCGLGLRRASGDLRRLAASVDQSHPCKKQLELGREIASVLDVWCVAGSDRIACEGNTVEVAGALAVSVLALDSDGLPVLLEKAMDYTWQYAAENATGPLSCQTDVTVRNVAYSLTGGSEMELRAELQIKANVYETLAVDVLTDLTADPNVPAVVSPAPLVLYYAAAGERVFDVARRYGTTTEAVLSANGLTEPVLANARPLLIPAVG